jgi:hypothetical protein
MAQIHWLGKIDAQAVGKPLTWEWAVNSVRRGGTVNFFGGCPDGTDVIAETDGAGKGKGYNPVRGAKVIAFAREFLDRSAPLAAGSHKDAAGYKVDGGKLAVTLKNGSSTGLKDAAQFIGYQGDAAAPSSVQPTGIALIALAGHNDGSGRLAKTIAWLRRSIGPETTPQSLAWAILGLKAHDVELPQADAWLAAAAAHVNQHDRSPHKLALLALAAKGWPL